MEKLEMLEAILDSYPYRVVFVDCDHVIRSLFDCHQELSRERIEAAVEKLRRHGNEIYLGVTPDNQRYYINPVRNEEGELLGYFERFELNLQK